MLNKKSSSFVTIITIIGAILIALGFSWLLYENWHGIPDPLKIVILVGLTLISYVIAIVLRQTNFPEIAKALFVAGALLYTLSVFLIAQIYGIPTGLQGYAWLLLICWVGIIFAAYLFGSYTSLIIALIEFLVWLTVQFLALMEKENQLGVFMIAILFLIAGIFFYGLGLLHKFFEHKFTKLFTFWSVFYFLILVYTLTFQYIVQSMWSYGNKWNGNALIFLIVFGVISIITIVSGILISLNKKKVSGKEIFGIILLIVILIGLIFLTRISSNVTGSCYVKSCYEFNNKNSCENAPKELNCKWGIPFISYRYSQNSKIEECFKPICPDFTNENLCVNTPDYLNCIWTNRSSGEKSSCMNLECGLLTSESECNSYRDKLGCKWLDYYCANNFCGDFKDKSSCEKAPKGLNCAWTESDYGSYCQQLDKDQEKCYKYENKKDECFSHIECQWHPHIAYYSEAGKIPFSVWFVWAVTNIFFILIILAVVGFGSLIKDKPIINLGILFFVIDIITRYIGFMMDMWGYTSLAVISIVGGILLLILGWFVSWISFKWRKNLIKSAEEINNNPNIKNE